MYIYRLGQVDQSKKIKNTEYINRFSSYLFWDVDKKELNMDNHAPYIIKRVLEYGQLADWNLLCEYYTLPGITIRAKEFKELESRALSYISVVSNTPINQFRCYTIQQSNPKHLNF